MRHVSVLPIGNHRNIDPCSLGLVALCLREPSNRVFCAEDAHISDSVWREANDCALKTPLDFTLRILWRNPRIFHEEEGLCDNIYTEIMFEFQVTVRLIERSRDIRDRKAQRGWRCRGLSVVAEIVRDDHIFMEGSV